MHEMTCLCVLKGSGSNLPVTEILGQIRFPGSVWVTQLSGADKNTTHWTPSYNRRINQLIDEEEDNRGKDEARSRQINQLKEDEEEERRKYKKGKKRRRGQKKMQFTRQDW